MSLRSAYERFLAAPNPQALSQTASLNYVTTLTSIHSAAQIVKHTEHQEKNVVKKKSWKVISSVEGKSSIALEVETVLEFVSSGGAYLPGMDTFIIDHVATLPVNHFVSFDSDNKISQIRLSWDQGSLLKQCDVIGTRGKNWPVYDGKDQVKLIASSSSSAASVAPATPPRGRNDDAAEPLERNFSPTKKHIKDPHTSLDLFAQRGAEDREPAAYQRPVAIRSSQKPPPRDHSELFAAGHEDLAPSPGGSPKKEYRENVIAPKGASQRRFESARLFEDDQDYQEPKIYKTNPARYNHFDIGDSDENDPMQFKRGPEPEPKKNIPMVARTNKGRSQWDFEDFATPAKVQQKHRDQDEVHFQFQDQPSGEQPVKGAGQSKARQQAESHFELQDDGTPLERANPPKARKDAASHFDFTDEPTPAPRRIIARTKAAAGLYADPVLGDHDDEADAPLGNITNNAGRRKNFDSQWDTADELPEAAKRVPPKGRANKGFESHWSLGDEEQDNPKTVQSTSRRQDKGLWDF